MTIPGSGPITATALTALTRPLETFCKGRDFAAWAGLTPFRRYTGGKQKLDAIAEALRALRQVQFQAGLAAECHNPLHKAGAERLKSKGKPLKLVAIARRLISIANAGLQSGIRWQHQPGT